MKKTNGFTTKLFWFVLWLALAGCMFFLSQGKGFAAEGEKAQTEKIAVIETNHGVIKFKFYPEDAPETVQNFINLASQGFYNGLIFHRVVKNFVIQGGCPLGNGRGNPGYFIRAEFNDRLHEPGTVAMARSQSPHSAGSQFYICLKKLPALDHKYTVFGQVIQGMDVVYEIGEMKTDNQKPLEDVVMERVYIEEVAIGGETDN